MHWRLGLKIREQFTVSAFSLTIWQTSLHILINIYWNKYGLIQTDATNDIVVYSFLVWLKTESITMHFNAAKCIVYMTKKIRIILLILDFKLGTIDNWKDYLQTWGEFFFFIIIIICFLINTGIRDFLLDIYSTYKSFVWTAALGLEFSGSNDIVLILPLY